MRKEFGSTYAAPDTIQTTIPPQAGAIPLDPTWGQSPKVTSEEDVKDMRAHIRVKNTRMTLTSL